MNKHRYQREIERDSIDGYTFKMSATSRAGIGRSQEPRNLSRLLMWVSGTQGLGPSFIAFPGASLGS